MSKLNKLKGIAAITRKAEGDGNGDGKQRLVCWSVQIVAASGMVCEGCFASGGTIVAVGLVL